MKSKILFSQIMLGIILLSTVPAFNQAPILLLDLDENNSSAPVIGATLDLLSADYEILTTFPPDLSVYEGIFVCLGIFLMYDIFLK